MIDNIKKINVLLIAIAILLFCIRVYLLDNSIKALLTKYINIKYFLPISNNEKNKGKKHINIILYVIHFIIIFVVLLNMFMIGIKK
jgi:hypothetical protein